MTEIIKTTKPPDDVKDNIMKSMGYEEYSYPALLFERFFGLEGIGVYWNMPEGKTMREVEDELWGNGVLNTIMSDDKPTGQPASDIMRLTNLYADMFRELNPELAVVEYDKASWYQARGFVHGVVSGFNTDDISGWVKNAVWTRTSLRCCSTRSAGNTRL